MNEYGKSECEKNNIKCNMRGKIFKIERVKSKFQKNQRFFVDFYGKYVISQKQDNIRSQFK